MNRTLVSRLRHSLLLVATALFAVTGAQAQGAAAPRVKLATSAGDIVIELYPDKAPRTVENFLEYVKDKHYESTVFHRVIDNFMIQGGGYTASMEQKKTRDPIENEAGNGLSNTVGTVAAARVPSWAKQSCTGMGIAGSVSICGPVLVKNTATSQFFINVNNNFFLDRTTTAPGKIVGQDDFGYTVFGRVVEGMDVVDKIKTMPTSSKRGHQNVPLTPITINTATVLP